MYINKSLFFPHSGHLLSEINRFQRLYAHTKLCTNLRQLKVDFRQLGYYVHFFKKIEKIYLFVLFISKVQRGRGREIGRGKEGEREREREFSIYCFTFQVDTIVRSGSGQIQEPSLPLGLPQGWWDPPTGFLFSSLHKCISRQLNWQESNQYLHQQSDMGC